MSVLSHTINVDYTHCNECNSYLKEFDILLPNSNTNASKCKFGYLHCEQCGLYIDMNGQNSENYDNLNKVFICSNSIAHKYCLCYSCAKLHGIKVNKQMDNNHDNVHCDTTNSKSTNTNTNNDICIIHDDKSSQNTQITEMTQTKMTDDVSESFLAEIANKIWDRVMVQWLLLLLAVLFLSPKSLFFSLEDDDSKLNNCNDKHINNNNNKCVPKLAMKKKNKHKKRKRGKKKRKHKKNTNAKHCSNVNVPIDHNYCNNV